LYRHLNRHAVAGLAGAVRGLASGSYTLYPLGQVGERVFKHRAADADNEYAMIDSTIVRAHQHSAGTQKSRRRRSDRPQQRRIEHQDQCDG
jgi:hypothetical protein